MRASGFGTGPTGCALAGQRCALWGWRKGVPGGGAFRRCGGRLGSSAPPPPTARPQGGLLGSATQVLWARVCGCGGPALALRLVCPAGGCAPRGWGGASEFRRPPFPAAHPLGRLPGPAGYALLVRMWMCAACVVSVRCVPCCVVSACSVGCQRPCPWLLCCFRVPQGVPELHQLAWPIYL